MTYKFNSFSDAPKIVADKQYCNIKYSGAEYCYAFEESNGNQIADSMKQKLATTQSVSFNVVLTFI